MLLPTLVNVLFALVPSAVIAVMHTTMIRASMTAYSTAVGPSSRARKFLTRSTSFRMVSLLCPLKKAGRTRVPGIAAYIAAYDDEVAVFRATLLNVLLAFWPRVVMAAMQTTTMRASITAYSTAVGPSSFCTNRAIALNHELMNLSPFLPVHRPAGPRSSARVMTQGK